MAATLVVEVDVKMVHPVGMKCDESRGDAGLFGQPNLGDRKDRCGKKAKSSSGVCKTGI
jgi:hypothetical protein